MHISLHTNYSTLLATTQLYHQNWIASNKLANYFTCAKDTTFAYQPSLQCTVESDKGVSNCIMNFEQHFLELVKISFHSYEKDMSIVVHLLLTFEIYGTFTIAMDDTIQSIAEEQYKLNTLPCFSSTPQIHVTTLLSPFPTQPHFLSPDL